MLLFSSSLPALEARVNLAPSLKQFQLHNSITLLILHWTAPFVLLRLVSLNTLSNSKHCRCRTLETKTRENTDPISPFSRLQTQQKRAGQSLDVGIHRLQTEQEQRCRVYTRRRLFVRDFFPPATGSPSSSRPSSPYYSPLARPSPFFLATSSSSPSAQDFSTSRFEVFPPPP